LTSAVISFGGWLAASVATVIALLAVRSMRTRMEAVARACHELRGPLTAARLGLQLGAGGGELSDVRLRALDLELARAALSLDDLETTKVETRPIRTAEELDLEALLADSVEAWTGFAAERGVRLEVQWLGGSGRACGQRLRLGQAIGNLIANAIEHGGQEVEVRGRAVHGSVRIEVIDSGPGLPAPVAELTRRARGGRGRRGRGLAIAASIAEDHGGRLASAPSERGARLVLELPPAGSTRAPVAS
jgi:signal transduction histidine kinase